MEKGSKAECELLPLLRRAQGAVPSTHVVLITTGNSRSWGSDGLSRPLRASALRQKFKVCFFFNSKTEGALTEDIVKGQT